MGAYFPCCLDTCIEGQREWQINNANSISCPCMGLTQCVTETLMYDLVAQAGSAPDLQEGIPQLTWSMPQTRSQPLLGGLLAPMMPHGHGRAGAVVAKEARGCQGNTNPGCCTASNAMAAALSVETINVCRTCAHHEHC